MKKFISTALAASILMSVTYVYAEIDMKKIVSDVKSRVSITDEYTDFSNNYYENGNITSYHLNWSSEDKDYVNIIYNSDDIITSYNVYDDSRWDSATSIPKLSAEDAQKAAQSFFDKANPACKGDFKVLPDENLNTALGSDYCFKIERYKNGAKVNSDYGNINVERDTGEILSMYISYTHFDNFDDVSNIISAADAKKLYKEKLGLELVYLSYTEDKKLIMFPAYVEKENQKYINAIDGEIYEAENIPVIYKKPSMMENASGAADYGDTKLTETEISELEKISGLISKADIEAQLRNNKLLNVSKDLPLKSISLNRSSYDDTEYIYRLSFRNDESYADAAVNAKTGELIYYTADCKDAENENIDEEKAKKSAEKVFEALAGAKKAEYKFEDADGNSVTYQRFVNGIKVKNDTISIAVDNSGKLLCYNSNYTTNVDFPSVADAMSADEAADKMFEAASYDLSYYPEINDEKITAKAVYMLSEQIKINPFTGALVDYRNSEVTEPSAYAYTDIEKHYAKNQIETLAKYGIGFDSAEFYPDKEINQRDFLSMVMSAADIYGSYENDDELYEAAQNREYITPEERDSDSGVTREFAAKVLTRVMGAERFAEYEDIYVTPFKDVTENKGYIAILSAMKLINGDGNGYFHPKNKLTRAEAACIIYNYLNK